MSCRPSYLAWTHYSALSSSDPPATTDRTPGRTMDTEEKHSTSQVPQRPLKLKSEKMKKQEALNSQKAKTLFEL